MRQFFLASVLLLISSIYVLLLNDLAVSSRVIQKVMVLPLFIVLIVFYAFSRFSWKKLITERSKWLLLFLFTVLIQLLVLSTGSISSPLLILIHLFMIGLSFVFSFSISILFLLSSCLVILADLWLHQDLIKLLVENPTPLVLQVASLIPIIPVAYIISQHYHLKDTLFKKLHTQVIADEAILEHINELIIITNPELRILSVNDAVERTLRQSRFELLDKPIFQILLLRDKQGEIVTDETFFPKQNTMTPSKIIPSEFIMVRSPFAKRNVTINVQPIKDVDKKISQISFIISFDNQEVRSEDFLKDTLEKTRTKYEAMAEYIKKRLDSPSLQDIKKEMIMLQKIESDIYNIHSLNEFPNSNKTSKIDVAQVCKQITQSEQELATMLNVPLEFKINNFGQKDIAPLIVKNFSVRPEELTGPFFTVSCNITYLELVIKKLTDITLLLAATVKDPQASLTIDRDNNDDVMVTASATCPSIPDEDLTNLYVPYYGNLYNKTYLYAGSGLEGYLLKTTSDALGLNLDVKYKEQPSSIITFTLVIKKNPQAVNHP